MASFVLVHGSWHGGWCFDAVKALLEAGGHEVIAPDLPGMGGDGFSHIGGLGNHLEVRT
jgi:pimeloyl-ACP methyl ester carboxylesterase